MSRSIERVGVIVAVDDKGLTKAEGQRLVDELEKTFPGVKFAVVSGCTSSVAFTYTPPSPAVA